MSIHKLELNVFRFDSTKDYTPIYEKCDFEYEAGDLLSSILAALPLRDFAYDKAIALKINHICVFSDLKVEELIERFGKEWTLEPISTKYAFKDLCIHKEMALKFYDRFFQSAPFISPAQKDELAKFININFISPQKNPEYFGDGFFLYVKWLLKLHPNEGKRLFESITDPKNGIMNFVSVSDFVFPKNDAIDTEIFELQAMLTQGSKCPFAPSRYTKLSKKLDEKYVFNAPKESSKKTSDLAYALFDGYEKSLNSAPLLLSSKALLDQLGLEVLDLHFCFDGGYWGRICDKVKFLLANAYNISLANQNQATLLLCDEDAYANASYTKKILDSDEQIKELINKQLKAYHLEYKSEAKIAYLNEMIAKEFQWEVSQKFEGFSTMLFGGSLQSSLQEIAYGGFLDRLELKYFQASLSSESYAHLFETNKDSSFMQSGSIRYEAIDLGVDFLMSTSMGQFQMFDTYSKKASKAYKRDFDATPTLLLPQLALLSMGEKNTKKLGLDLHKNKVRFI